MPPFPPKCVVENTPIFLVQHPLSRARTVFLHPLFSSITITAAMARSKELTPAIRERICELHAINWGYKRIHQRYPSIPISTIRYTIKKEPERREGVSKRRSGRPKKTKETDQSPKADNDSKAGSDPKTDGPSKADEDRVLTDVTERNTDSIASGARVDSASS